MTPLLSLERVTTSRAARQGRRTVLDAVSCAIAAGELVGLLGPNGAGKTTLMRTAIGLAAPESGRIRLMGDDLGRLPPSERARRAAYIPQDRSIAWPVTVETLVGLGRQPHRTTEAENRAAVARALAETGLEALGHRLATRLSGGERARALIARALAQDAPLLVADEPMAGLDPAHSLALMEALRRLARGGRGILVSLHDLGLAARWCDRVILLAGGQVIAQGHPRAVLTPERLAAVYGITAHFAEDDGGLILVPTAVLGG